MINICVEVFKTRLRGIIQGMPKENKTFRKYYAGYASIFYVAGNFYPNIVWNEILGRRVL